MSAVEDIPGFGVASTVYEYFAPDFIKTKDPFYIEENGQEKRRRAPEKANERQRKDWKRVIKKAWQYDRNFCCGGCVGFDLGLGIIPIINILPVIGPIISYTLQASLIRICGEAGAPLSVQAQMTANCGTDFVISLCPLLGIVCCWLFGCATRNAAIFDTWLRRSSEQGPVAPGPHYRGKQANQANPHPLAAPGSTPATTLATTPGSAPSAPIGDRNPYGRPLSQISMSRTSVAQFAPMASPAPRPAPVDL